MIHLQRVQAITKEQSRIIAKWYNDPEIAPKIHVNRKEEPLPYMDNETLFEQMNKSATNKHVLLAFDDEKLIGDCSVDMQFMMLGKEEEDTAWISICIGDKDYWGNGTGKLMMAQLEDFCWSLGAKRIELGVFELNTAARRFYEKCQYHPFKTFPNFTFYDGRWWDDYRMEKVRPIADPTQNKA